MRLSSVRWGKRPIPIGIPSGDHSLMTMSSRAGMLYETPRRPQRRPEPVVRTIISRDGEQAMREELSRLRQELESFPERLKESHSFGESKQNDDYLQIREEQAVVASRILQLETLLDSSRVVDTGGARQRSSASAQWPGSGTSPPTRFVSIVLLGAISPSALMRSQSTRRPARPSMAALSGTRSPSFSREAGFDSLS